MVDAPVVVGTPLDQCAPAPSRRFLPRQPVRPLHDEPDGASVPLTPSGRPDTSGIQGVGDALQGSDPARCMSAMMGAFTSPRPRKFTLLVERWK